jgi:hypothetical protein
MITHDAFNGFQTSIFFRAVQVTLVIMRITLHLGIIFMLLKYSGNSKTAAMAIQSSFCPRRSLQKLIPTSLIKKQKAHQFSAFATNSRRFSVAVSASGAPKIGVIGGGVIGLTCALRLLERSPAEVTLITDKLAIDTTSAGAAGLWKPYAIGGTSPEK